MMNCFKMTWWNERQVWLCFLQIPHTHILQGKKSECVKDETAFNIQWQVQQPQGPEILLNPLPDFINKQHSIRINYMERDWRYSGYTVYVSALYPFSLSTNTVWDGCPDVWILETFKFEDFWRFIREFQVFQVHSWAIYTLLIINFLPS